MPIPLKVLIVDDSEDDALLLRRELERGGYELTCRRVDTEKDMISALKSDSWDLVISDFLMPCFSGPDALKVLRWQGVDLPFILVSGKVGEETAVEAIKAGANDYILNASSKPPMKASGSWMPKIASPLPIVSWRRCWVTPRKRCWGCPSSSL